MRDIMKTKLIATMIVCMFVFMATPILATETIEPEDVPPVWKTFLFGAIKDSYVDKTTYSYDVLFFKAIFVVGWAKDSTSGGGPIPYIFINKNVGVLNAFSIGITGDNFVFCVFDGKAILP